MLSAKLQRLAANKIPALFAAKGTDYVRILRDEVTVNDYGGAATDDTDTGSPIPCVLLTRSGSKWQLGEEFLDGRILLPAMYDGDVVDLLMTDKLEIEEREGNNPERVFSVKDIQNKFGVYLDVGVVTES